MTKKGLRKSTLKISRRSFLKSAIIVGVAAAIAGSPWVSPRAWGQEKKPIKLGGMFSLTGAFATESEDQRRAIQMVVDEYNKKGGLLGRPIEFVVRDDKLNAGEAALKAKELIEKEKIDLAIGTLGAHTVVVYNAECKMHNIPLMALNSTNDLNKMPDWGSYTFHEGSTPYMITHSMGHWILNNLGKKWYFLCGTWAFGQQVYDGFQKFMAKYGGENLGKSDYQLGSTEYSVLFPKILDAKPEVLITTGFGKDYVNQAKQLTDFGLTKKMKVVFALTELTMGKEAGQANIAGTYGGTQFYWGLQDTIPTAKAFVQAFMSRYGQPPSGYAGFAFSGAKELLGAVERARTLDPEKIRQQLEGRSYDTYKGKQWWRKCDHQSFQDWYVLKGKDPKESKGPWDFFEIVGKIPADEKWERTCEELGFK